MRVLTVPIIIIVCLVFGGCSAKNSYKSEFEFANKLAQDGLWKEAHYRWSKVLKTGKATVALYNNMAIALEEMGKPDEAEKMYQKALKLDPGNVTVKSNYDAFKNVLKGKDLIGKDKNEKPKKESKRKRR